MSSSRSRGFGWLEVIIVLAILGAITAGIAFIYQRGYSAGKTEIQGEWDTAKLEQREKDEKQGATASEGLEADRGKAKIVFRTVTELVNVEVEKPVYRDVCLPPDGLRLARCAIRGESPDTCKLDEPVRPPAGSDGGNRSLSLAMDYGSLGALQGLR